MTEPPFQMPGHRWDPEKKRFFKILPGPTSTDPAASGLAGSADSNHSPKGKKRERLDSAESSFAKTPRLPAIDVRSDAQKLSLEPPSRFCRTIADPITQRQQGRTSLASREMNAGSQIEAAYSRLVLRTARRPMCTRGRHAEIVSLQTDADGQSLFLLTSECIIRSCPWHGFDTVFWAAPEVMTSPSLWRSSQGLWFGFFNSKGLLEALHTFRMEGADRTPGSERAPGVSQTPPCDEVFSHGFRSPLRSHGMEVWAFTEKIYDPRSNHWGSMQDASRKKQHELDSTVFCAISSGKVLHTFAFISPFRGDRRGPSTSQPLDSDITAITFDHGSMALFCGTRSGHIYFWPSIDEMLQPASDGSRSSIPTSIAPTGSLTDLAIISSNELLVVRINGSVQMVDRASGQVVREYQGHVNSYQFSLGFAVDRDLRLLALAGIDRRVRVWSVDSAVPLGTVARSLYRYQKSDTQALYDETDSPLFEQAHRAKKGGQTALRLGKTLSSIVFNKDVKVLHWHPRSVADEGRDPYEAQAIRAERGVENDPPQHRWKDLYVGVGEWLYQFRFP